MTKKHSESATVVTLCLILAAILCFFVWLFNRIKPDRQYHWPHTSQVEASHNSSTSSGGVSADPLPPTTASKPPDLVLFEAIRIVEGDDGEIGPDGERGPYRITPGYWWDACEYGGVDLDYDTWVRSQQHCEQVMEWYWARYGALADEQKARMHNGGPLGMEKESTVEYWCKVKELLD